MGVGGGGESSSEGSRSALREMTCWIACDLFHEGLRIPVRTRVFSVLLIIYFFINKVNNYDY